MKISDRISSFLTRLAATVKSSVKILLQSRPSHIERIDRGEKRLIIMGNGPSLALTIRDNSSALLSEDTMAVNFAANTPEFFELRPKYYILVDPHFFESTDENVKRLMKNLSRVDWSMTLLVPHGVTIPEKLRNPAIRVTRFNATGAEGFDWFTRWVYSRQLAMPRPRNVLIPAIMAGIALGYKRIHITGADHTWTRTLSVDDSNRVVTVQPHFYKESEKEEERIKSVYNNVRLHEILYSFHVAFLSYHQIKKYADKAGTSIINSTPGSFIDAFPREEL